MKTIKSSLLLCTLLRLIKPKSVVEGLHRCINESELFSRLFCLFFVMNNQVVKSCYKQLLRLARELDAKPVMKVLLHDSYLQIVYPIRRNSRVYDVI